MLTTLLMAAMFAAPPIEFEVKLDSIRTAVVGDFLPLGDLDGRPEVLLWMNNGDVIVMPFDTVTLQGESVIFDQDFDRGEENDNVNLKHSWESGRSTITVITDCARYTLTKCVKIHANAAMLMQEAFPENHDN